MSEPPNPRCASCGRSANDSVDHYIYLSGRVRMTGGGVSASENSALVPESYCSRCALRVRAAEVWARVGSLRSDWLLALGWTLLIACAGGLAMMGGRPTTPSGAVTNVLIGLVIGVGAAWMPGIVFYKAIPLGHWLVGSFFLLASKILRRSTDREYDAVVPRRDHSSSNSGLLGMSAGPVRIKRAQPPPPPADDSPVRPVVLSATWRWALIVLALAGVAIAAELAAAALTWESPYRVVP